MRCLELFYYLDFLRAGFFAFAAFTTPRRIVSAFDGKGIAAL
jgi:hypothetical protein